MSGAVIRCNQDIYIKLLPSTHLQVPFLNLMALLLQRGGNVHVRVGGNTQETATIVDSIPGGKVLTKLNGNSSGRVSANNEPFSL